MHQSRWFESKIQIPGNSKVLLKSDGDICTMVMVCRQMNVGRIDFEVNFMETDCGMNEYEVDVIQNGSWSLQIVDEDENETNFYTHREELLKGSQWSLGINQDEGQKFEGGPVEFRKALCKFAIEVGFQFKYLKNDKQRVTTIYKFRMKRVVDGGFMRLGRW